MTFKEKKMNTEYIAYGFQVAESELTIEESCCLIPCEDSFPDDWAFEHWKVDQIEVEGVKYWKVEEK